MAYRCKERLWLTLEGELVHEGDPRARTLFATPGMELNEAPKVLPMPGEKGIKALKPAENKAIKPGEDK